MHDPLDLSESPTKTPLERVVVRREALEAAPQESARGVGNQHDPSVYAARHQSVAVTLRVSACARTQCNSRADRRRFIRSAGLPSSVVPPFNPSVPRTGVGTIHPTQPTPSSGGPPGGGRSASRSSAQRSPRDRSDATAPGASTPQAPRLRPTCAWHPTAVQSIDRSRSRTQRCLYSQAPPPRL